MRTIESYLQEAYEKGASDIHLDPASTVRYRIDGELVAASEEKLSSYQIEELMSAFMTSEQKEALRMRGEIDFSHSVEGRYRVRVNVFRQRGTYAAAIRLLSSEIPSARQLGIPESVQLLAGKKRGLVLVTGPTGSGKSTTLASLVHIIAKKYPKIIITLEDPIEFLHTHDRSVVLQREIGNDTSSYACALRAALREDPDVILVGEMRDIDTIRIAITAAETGHLVLSTLHTNNAPATIDRIIDVFPPHQQQQIKIQLANVLEGIIAQQLIPKRGGGRVAAFEVMLAAPAVRNLIREGKSFQIPSLIQTSKKYGMQTMDDAIYDLLIKELISAEDAVAFAQDTVAMQQKIGVR